MDRPFVVEPAVAVRARIARTILGVAHCEPLLGSIRLKPHQSSSIGRLESALNEFGGALLCDAVGMGKTYVALAIARKYSRRLIVAPAALREMWRDALRRSDLDAGFISYERLSRGEPSTLAPDILILDESHHARNRGTRRYGRIAGLTREARVLLLTATPVHNRRADLTALLSLFLGSRAATLTDREMSRCVVRRERADAPDATGIPRIVPVTACSVPDDPDLVARLMSLPQPLPVREGESGGVLINRGLVHQWSSSEAALRDALRRRLAKATALIASLRAGRYPTAAELEAWTFADGALQLGFAELLAPPVTDAPTLLQAVLSHAKALELFLTGYTGASLIDEARARSLVHIRCENSGVKVVAFAQYSSTISTLFRRLVGDGGVAMLTATGARVAGGRMSRREAIARFAPRANGAASPPRSEAIDLLLATDLLSEGVNLQDAAVVVHLDVPWTAARMEQRVGRVARMGSAHSHVRVYRVRPPASAEAVLHEEALVSAKWAVARNVVGAASVPSRAEHLQTILRRWVDAHENSVGIDEQIAVSTVIASQAGFVAAGTLGTTPVLVVRLENEVSIELDAQIAACLLAEGRQTSAESHGYETAVIAIRDWCERHEASRHAGVGDAEPVGRTRLLSRIDAALQGAPPHLRARRASAVASAREVASASHGIAVENDLDAIARSTLPDDDWLDAIVALAAHSGTAHSPSGGNFQLRALLLLMTGS